MERNTRQSQALLAVLREQKRPITSKELHEEGRKKIPRLGIATVYRAIRSMMEAEQIVSLDYPGQPTRYELPTHTDHPHFLCASCSKVFDLPPQEFDISPKLPRGFKSTGFEVVVYGLCPQCA